MIHSSAIIDSNAEISDKADIGPYCVIGSGVKIEENTKIHSHVNIIGNTTIGKNNEIFPFVSIGTNPQDLKYKGESNSIIIGDNNKLREYVNINPGTKAGGTITRLGNNNLLMVYCHIAHDCNLGNNIVLANNVQVGGHVTIEDNAIIGGSCAIHQFSRIGQLAMIGGMTGVLRRAKVSNDDIKSLQNFYDIVFTNQNFRSNIDNLKKDKKENKYIKTIIEFVNADKRRPISLPASIK